MDVIAFDQSSKKTGWSHFRDGKCVKSGVIDKHKITDIDIRIGEMGIAICDKIAEIKPDVVVIEDVQSQGSVATVVFLARLQGFILGWCYVHGIKTQIMRPSEWRAMLQFRQGPKVKRAELKAQSIGYVLDTYGLDLSEDECESICLNDAAHQKYGY